MGVGEVLIKTQRAGRENLLGQHGISFDVVVEEVLSRQHEGLDMSSVT